MGKVGLKEVAEGGFVVTRDESGQIKPVEGVTPQLGLRIKLIPLTYGASLQYKNFYEGIFQWPVEDQAQVIREQVLECEGDTFENLDVESLQQMEAWAVMDILQAIALYSGFSRLFLAQAKAKGLVDDEGNLKLPEMPLSD